MIHRGTKVSLLYLPKLRQGLGYLRMKSSPEQEEDLLASRASSFVGIDGVLKPWSQQWRIAWSTVMKVLLSNMGGMFF